MARGKSGILPIVSAAAGKGIVIQISADPSTTRAALEQIREQMRQTALEGKKDTSELTANFNALKTAMVGFASGFVLRQVISEMREMVGASVGLGVEIGRLSQQTGMSAENLSTLKYVADQTGIGFETLTKGFKKFSVEILGAEEGKKTSIASFKRLGISQQEVRDHSKDMYDMLGLVADRFQQLPAGANKGAEAQALFGKAGAALIPVLNKGREGIEAYKAEAKSLGIVLDEAGVAKMEALHAATVRLDGAIEGAKLGITGGMEPALEGLAAAFTSSITKGEGFAAVGRTIGNALLGAANAAAYAVKLIRQTGDAVLALQALSSGDKEGYASARADSRAADKDYDAFQGALASSYSEGPADPNSPEERRKRRLARLAQSNGTGDIVPQDQSGTKLKSGNPIAEARAKLAEAQEQLEATRRRAADQAMLAETEAQHKLLLVADEDYFKRKLDVQNDELDAEETALKAKQKTLLDLAAKQKTLRLNRDTKGDSAEELRTQAALVELHGKLLEIQSKRQQVESAYNAEVGAAGMAAELNSLRLAAALERERGDGIAAQIALIQKERELEARDVVRKGGSDADAAAVRSAGELQVKRLQLKDVEVDIARIQNESVREQGKINDALNKNEINKRTAAQRTREENARELQQLQQKVAEAEAYAKAIGDPALLERVKDMQAKLENLGRTDHRGTFGKEITDGMQSMTERLAESAAMGKESFGSMVNSMLQDAERLALRLAEQKFLEPLFENAASGATGGASGGGFWASIFGAGAEHHMSGGVGGDGPQVVGEAGPEVWNPPTRGGTYTPSNLLAKVAENGGGGRAPNITQNITNASRQPVTAQPPQVSYDEQSKAFVIHTLLTDYAEGGPLSQMHAG